MNDRPKIDLARLEVLRPCMENYDVGSPDAEWPNNLISRLAVANAVDPEEVALCRRLAGEAERVMEGASVGMGSQADSPFRPFFVVAPADRPATARIDEALVRAAFGGTLFPPATIAIEPFAETTTWWDEVALDGEGSEPEYFDPWRAMCRWFTEEPAFIDRAFVRVGDARALFALPETQYPPGTEITGGVLPRLALGLTAKGSLAGLFGYVVQG